MKPKLPRHIRGIGWDGKKLGPRHKDKYWDGRWALDHPNGYPDDERNVETLKLLLNRAQIALGDLKGDVVPEEQADLLNLAYQALNDIDKHFPRVECWVMYDTYVGHDGYESPVRPFFGFFDLDDALTVASMWQEYKDQWKGTQYYVTRGGAEIYMVIDPKFKDLERLRPGRR